MSGYQGSNTTEGGLGFAELGTSKLGSELVDLLLCDSIQPGSPPGYQICKIIYLYHPLGAKIAEIPINMAQSQSRQITIPAGPEGRLIPAFEREWKALGGVGADVLIHNTYKTARIYGIGSIGVGDRQNSASDALPLDRLHELDLYFNVLDPLNTAGSLVLNQDPNSPDFQRPRAITAAGKEWHPSRTVVVLNEQPIYIAWSESAFGFVGRSVYQRALYPLKSYVQSMVTDDLVAKKVGLLVAKMQAPGSTINGRMLSLFGIKRQQLKSGVTGNVLTIGKDESIESLNFQNLEGAGRFARENILKNIGMGAGMPAIMLDEETLARGMAEGTEDAKNIARYIDRVRLEMQPLYTFFDTIVQRRAWSPEFYEGIKRDYSQYRDVPYETAFYQWKNSFTPAWPNLLVEPDSEKIKVEETRFKSVVALIEVLAPLMDPDNKATLVQWAADQCNDRRELFSAPLLLDEEALRTYEPAMPSAAGGEEDKEPLPVPFSSRT